MKFGMSDERTTSTQVPSFQKARRIFEREKVSYTKTDEQIGKKGNSHYAKACEKTDEDVGEKENAHCVNSWEKGESLQTRPKSKMNSRVPVDKGDIEEKDIEDVPLEGRLSSDLHDDEDLSQGVPLSIKNFFKVVRTATFSKRVPRSTRPRLEPNRNAKDTDVVIFERPTAAQDVSVPAGVSRSLPPILDFHDLFGSDKSPDEEWEKDLDKLEMFPRFKTEGNNSTLRSLGSLEKRSFPKVGSGVGRHRCPGFSTDSTADGLQEFGSLDEFSTVRRGRETRKSLYKQLEDLDALHF